MELDLGMPHRSSNVRRRAFNGGRRVFPAARPGHLLAAKVEFLVPDPPSKPSKEGGEKEEPFHRTPEIGKQMAG
jgi:hypothetical protein